MIAKNDALSEEMILRQVSYSFLFFFFANLWRAAAAWCRIPGILPHIHEHANTHARTFSLIFESDKILMTLLGKLGIFSHMTKPNYTHTQHTHLHTHLPPHTHTHIHGCLAWSGQFRWVGEAVMTKAGQIGKPHPAGTGEEGHGS